MPFIAHSIGSEGGTLYTQIDSNAVAEVKAKADIVEIVSEQVRLQKKGKYYFGCCPFHLEKTASFSVSQERQMYYCFGCHAGGDVISFLMQTVGMTFAQAVEKLADRYGVKINVNELTVSEKKTLEERDEILRLYEVATNWYENQLHGNNAKQALTYLEKRKISIETMKKFQIGFATGDLLSQHLVNKGIDKRLLIKSGIVAENEQGHIRDRFRNRVIFPIHDYRGRVIAFGGRVIDDSLPKYVNSPETSIYSKSQNLYGLSHAAQTIRQKNNVILAEGYLDVISLHQHGITNAVASLGTALTVEQSKLLLRYSDKIYFAYDTDNAGKKAARKGIYILNDIGFNIKVIIYPDAKDPDEFLNKHDQNAFLELQNHAQSAFAFLMDFAASDRDLHNPSDKAEILKDVFEFINSTEDAVVREEYLKQITFYLGVNESAVFAEFRKFQKKIPRNVNFSDKIGKNTFIANNPPKEAYQTDRYRAKVISEALQNKQCRTKIAQLLNFPFSENEEEEKLLKMILQDTEAETENLISRMPEEWQSRTREILFNEKFELEGKETIEDIISFLYKQNFKKRLEEINAQLARFNATSNLPAEALTLLAERQKLQERLKAQPLRGRE